VSATRFTELIGCELPIQQAPMGGVATSPDLAVAVSNAGGQGMVAAVTLPAPALSAILDDVAGKTTRPFGVSFLMPFLDSECVEMAASRVRLVDFFYGDPDPELVKLVHEGGALASWQVGSPEEAAAAAGAGCDVVVAQGVEAGGHVRGRTELLPLLEQVLGRVDVPVVAAGGIATAARVEDVMRAGADAVRVGTRFIASPEANAHPSYIDALLDASADDTVLTEAFSAMWPDAPHRVLRSSVEAAAGLDEEIIGEIEMGGEKMPVPRFSVIPPGRIASGELGAMSLYAGLGVGEIESVSPAAEIVAELAEGAAATSDRQDRSPGGP
jgi:nitronate monooxygenase